MQSQRDCGAAAKSRLTLRKRSVSYHFLAVLNVLTGTPFVFQHLLKPATLPRPSLLPPILFGLRSFGASPRALGLSRSGRRWAGPIVFFRMMMAVRQVSQMPLELQFIHIRFTPGFAC